ncbi:hypothetical protein CALCODRAFT_444805, partial [Calocera cornea HHB12733]
VIVNNAAHLASEFEVSSEGLSTVFAADHVSPFVFTTTLLPLREATAMQPGADVALSQHLKPLARTKFDSIDDFREKCGPDASVNGLSAKFARYAQAKLANILFAKELQKRLDAAGVPILSISLHPGNIATGGSSALLRTTRHPRLRGRPALAALDWPLMTPQQGAITQLLATTSPEVRREAAKLGGRYLVPYGTVGEASEVARREELPRQLWETTRGLWGRYWRRGGCGCGGRSGLVRGMRQNMIVQKTR